jgi:hypothetical protein
MSKKKMMTMMMYAMGILFLTYGVYQLSQSLVFSLKTPPSSSAIRFLSASEIQKVIDSDDDHYYDTFHRVDFDVRKVQNKKEYLDKIASSGCEGDDQVREKITQCIRKVHDTLVSNHHHSAVILGIHMDTFLKIPWKIGFVCDKKYENGLPHTRGNVIILNAMDVKNRTTSQLCRLLIHEQTHVYQKTKDMTAYLNQKYKVVQSKKADESIPANPDTNSYIYKNIETNEVLEGKYNKAPTHFRDISFTRDDHTLEHPYEHIAYNMEKLYTTK